MEPINIAQRLFREGNTLWKQSRLAEAIQKFETALLHCDKEHWFYPEFLEAFGHLLSEAGRYDDAITKLEMCEEEHLKRGEDETSNEIILPRLGIAEIHINLGHKEKGIRLLEEYGKKGGRSSYLFFEKLAFVYFETREKLKARSAALKAIEIFKKQRDTTTYETKFTHILKNS